MEGFHYDAHPMAMLVSTVAALVHRLPPGERDQDPANRLLQIKRLIGKMPSIAAMSSPALVSGSPYVYPDNDFSYAREFHEHAVEDGRAQVRSQSRHSPGLGHSVSSLHADHEQNCSTNAMRSVGSAHTDPYLATRAAAAALAGPLHGGPMKRFFEMLDEIGSKENVYAYIKKIKEGHGKLMGFGHRVYKNYDPRAKIIKWTAENVFEVTGRNPKLEIALELERIALEDEYFVHASSIPTWTSTQGSFTRPWASRPEMFTRAVCHPTHGGVAGPMARDDHRSRAEDRTSAPGLIRGTSYGRLCPLKSACRLMPVSLHPTALCC
jgi:citrate synthase